MAYPVAYFKDLAIQSSSILNELPIELTPQPLSYSLNKLKPEIDRLRNIHIQAINSINKQPVNKTDNKLAQGLNTIGMLADRFTILLIREWCLRNKGNKDSEKADLLFSTQTTEIINAMAEAKAGYSSLNSKITHIKANAQADSWEAAYHGLLTTNLLLWESQEVLYIKDIQSLPVEEIRDYIKWFSFGNILRNEFIELCELNYWQTFKH